MWVVGGDQAAPRGPARAVLDLDQGGGDLPFSAGMLTQALLAERGAVKMAWSVFHAT